MNLPLFFYFLRPYKKLYVTIFSVMIVSSVLDAFSLAAFFPLLSSMVGESGEDLTGIRRWITSIAELLPVADPIMAAAIVLLTAFALRAVFGLMREGLGAYGSGRVLYDIKNRLIERYSEHSYQFFLDNKLGNLISRSLVAPSHVATLMRRLPQMATEALRVIAILIVLVLIFPSGVMVLGVLALAYYQVIRYLSRKVSYNVGRERVKFREAEHVIANELIAGIRHMTAFCTTRHWVKQFETKNRAFTYLWTKHHIWLSVPKQLMEFSALLVILGLLFVLRSQASGNLGEVLPELGIFAAGLVQLLPTVTELGRMRMEVLGILPEGEAVHAALVEPSLRPRQGDRLFTSFQTGISFEQVHFAHAGRDLLLRGLNIEFKKGKTTALVGASGAGKSTIVNLLLGLYEPTQGRIMIDDTPLSEYDMESWRRSIGFVSQDPFVVHGTVKENIVFGRDGYSESDVTTAAKLANADLFIRELSDEYDTVVGERGMKLSGGQQQRLCLARALLSNPQLLLLDEATSSLDSISERAVQDTISDISQDRTVIQIAHRGSTIEGADHIVVLHEGQIVETGSHTDLLRNDGEYARLFTTASQ